MEFSEFVLAASTADLADEPAARESADAIEFRMDLADGGLSDLRSYDGTLPLLVTDRVESEGGAAADSTDRIDRLAAAVSEPAVAAVDVELAALRDGTARPVVERAEAAGVSVVVSAHDFEGTPDREHMRETLVAAAARGDVGKLAVTADGPGDVLDLLAVTHEATVTGRRVATMAMGEAGRHSRAVAPLYGSRIGYAPVDPADATAPGQYDLGTLAELVARLGGRAQH
jgi:3-dehydroquinate dehydratase-1